MKNFTLMVAALALLGSSAHAEIRQMDMTIFGMD
jgi:hypothetical protein